MLLVDSGSLFADARTTHGFLRGDGVTKSDWVTKAYNRYDVDAINLSAIDLFYVATLTARNEWEAKTASHPALKRLVSANIVSAAPVFKPLPFLVREVNLPNQQKPVRVAFVGLTEMAGPTPALFTITDPVAAALRVVPEARKNADVVIILAHVKAPEAVQIARQVQGVSAIITGTGDFFTPSLKIGNTLIDFTPFETRSLGELRFYRDAEGNFTVRDRFISLDDVVPDDPEAADLGATATKEGEKVYYDAQKVLKDWQLQATAATMIESKKLEPKKEPGSSATATYISAQACAQCHSAQYFKWVNTKHARTSDSLMLKKDEFDVSCLQCHGSIRRNADELPRFASLQCEQCHGPGSLHAAKPAKGYGKVDLKSACISCHTPQTSPSFDLQTAWLKIKH